MAQVFQIHPDNPQLRLIKQAINIIRSGGVVVYPTDAGYALGCQFGDSEAVNRIRKLRHLSEAHFFTLMCNGISQLADYAIVDNVSFKILKKYTPGPYTFIVQAKKKIPKRFLQPKRKTIGMRIPDSTIIRKLIDELGDPLISVSLISAKDSLDCNDFDEFIKYYQKQIDLVIQAGIVSIQPTTIVDLTHV